MQRQWNNSFIFQPIELKWLTLNPCIHYGQPCESSLSEQLVKQQLVYTEDLNITVFFHNKSLLEIGEEE